MMLSRLPLCVLALAAIAATIQSQAATGHRPAGSPLGNDSIYATDAYPGFDGLDDLPKAEKKTTSWFLHVSRETPAEQLAYARAEEDAGNLRAARRGYDALVREWPASPEAPQAQLALAMLYAKKLGDYEEAFEALGYLLDFYARDCDYAELADYQYKLANVMNRERNTFLGFSFTSTRVLRQHYEMAVRRAPGSSFVPDAMLQIAALREEDQQYEEAVLVYAEIAVRFPRSQEAERAVYLNAKCRMWLVRRLAYNLPRCTDTAAFLKRVLREWPKHPQEEEMREWLRELQSYMAEDAYTRAKFYDSRQRTRHAAVASYKKFLEEYPDSRHAAEVRARIEELQPGDGAPAQEVK